MMVLLDAGVTVSLDGCFVMFTKFKKDHKDGEGISLPGEKSRLVLILADQGETIK